MLTLVLGGAGSGKSQIAEQLAADLRPRVVYIAPGQASDREMANRIEAHRRRRPPEWQTVEEPLALADTVKRYGNPHSCLLIDSLGSWISNLLLNQSENLQIRSRVISLLNALQETGGPTVIVSEETGLGVIPASTLGRQFRDCIGAANQMAAAAAHRALLVVAGIPIDLKALAITL